MKIIFILVFIAVLYIIVVLLRYFFSKKEIKIKQYFFDFRTNFLLIFIVLAIFISFFKEYFQVDSTDFFLSLDWLIIFF